MTDLLAHIENAIQSRKLLRRADSVLVAVSGGVDSMVLLHALQVLAERHRWKLFVAHFNHQLRGRASDADERLVRETAAARGLKFFAQRADIRALARRRKESIEMTARTLRHEFLARTAHKLGCRTVALAHHADDQVELFFLRLFRGAGTEGLAGMRWKGTSPIDARIELVRPLLDLGKTDLQQFARAHKIQFREDSTNASLDIRRNQIRHHLLPLLRRKYQPALDRTVLRTMEIIAAEADVVSHLTTSASGRFDDLPVAVQRRRLQSQLQRLGIAADFYLVEALRLADSKVITVSEKHRVSRDAQGVVKLVGLAAATFSAAEHTFRLNGRAGEVSFAGGRGHWQLEATPGTRLGTAVSGCEAFDAARIGAKVVLRHWRPGDRYQPIGMEAAIKLQDWFTNRKVPRAKRHELLVATTGAGEIFWVENQRIAERFKLTPQTRKRLIWRWARS